MKKVKMSARNGSAPGGKKTASLSRGAKKPAFKKEPKAKAATKKSPVAQKISPAKSKESTFRKGEIWQKPWIFWAKTAGKTVLWTAGAVLVVLVLLFIYINLPVPGSKEKVPMGVTFSSRYAGDIGLDWKKNYLAMLDELGIRKIRIPVYWDLVQKSPDNFDFSDIDWQLDEAAKRRAEVTLVVGQKVPRWPECFIPEWAGGDEAERKERQVAFVEKTVERYKNHSAVARWQVENEPFLDFGVCPVMDPELLDREIAAVRALDGSRPIVVTDSGELSLWLNAAKRADIFGTTMYREVYTAEYGHWRYPIGPNFFKLKRWMISAFAGQENAIVIELQGEPWVKGWTVHAPLATQLASMNAEILKDNFEFAKKTGVSEIYVWGVEWWYWMKEEHRDSTLWDQAKALNHE